MHISLHAHNFSKGLAGNMQFTVNKVKIQFPDVEHCCPISLGSLVPIEQLYIAQHLESHIFDALSS